MQLVLEIRCLLQLDLLLRFTTHSTRKIWSWMDNEPQWWISLCLGHLLDRQ